MHAGWLNIIHTYSIYVQIKRIHYSETDKNKWQYVQYWYIQYQERMDTKENVKKVYLHYNKEHI